MRQLFIDTPEFNQRLDLIRHLIGNSDRIPLLCGVDGVGKSALLTRLEEVAPDNWDVCRLDATATLQPNQLYPLLGRCYGSPGEGFIDADGLMRRFEDFQQAGRLPVLLVDDAHLLPLVTLVELIELQLAAIRQETRIALVLAATKQIDDQIKSEQLRHAGHFLLILEMLPLDRDQTEQLVRETLAAGSAHGLVRKTTSWINKLYSESEGVPGKIRKRLEGVMSGDEAGLSLTGISTSKLSFISDIPFPVIAGSLLLVLLMGLTLVFQDEINSVFEPETAEVDLQVLPELSGEQVTPLTLPEQIEAEPDTGPEEVVEQIELSEPEPPLASLDTPTVTEAGSLAEPKPFAIVEETNTRPVDIGVDGSPADTGSPPPAEPGDQAGSSGQAAVEGDKVSAAAESETEQIEKTEPAPIEVPAVSTTGKGAPVTGTRSADRQVQGEKKGEQGRAPVPVVEQSLAAKPPLPAGRTGADNAVGVPGEKSPAPVVDEGIRREAWLLKQRPQYYTLQLIGLKDEKGVDQFIRRNRLQGKVAYFRSLRGGAPWYSVVYGVYPTRAEAKAAIENLPKNLAGKGVWPRTIASIQEAIRVR